MGFDNLWEKYGQKKESGQVLERQQQEQRTTGQPVNQIQPKSDLPSRYKEEAPLSVKQRNGQGRKEETESSMPGVFGDEIAKVGGYSGDRKKRIEIDWNVVRGLPWIDIIFITITIAMIVGVIVNFERVTTALFYLLLPLLSDIFVLLFIIGVIACGIRWFTRRPRRR